MSVTANSARHIRIWVITICIVLGAGLPFLIPGAAAVRAFTDIEARIGYGAFAAIIHAAIGGLLGWGIAELIIYVAGGGPARSDPDGRAPGSQLPNDRTDR